MNTTNVALAIDLLTRVEQEALARLLTHAQGGTGQSRKVANFLLAWWNSASCGAFDLTTLWGVDEAIAADMAVVFTMIARVARYPDALGYSKPFDAVVRAWRPELIEE